MMNELIDLTMFSRGGQGIMYGLLVVGVLLGVSGIINLLWPRSVLERPTAWAMVAVNIIFLAGFFWICRLHYQIYCQLPLEMSESMVSWFNNYMQRSAGSGLPLLDPSRSIRYTVPLWIENEKYYFWFMCYSIMALVVHFRITNHRLRALLHLMLSGQILIMFFAADPFIQPLPKFFSEIQPWFAGSQTSVERLRLFMQLYPRMTYYYNASYMWIHPPMLFLSYACITITFVTSIFMLGVRDMTIENTGYDFAKLGFVLLTLGMLLGYPWALQAWGENWWWDPKICSSIMMWSIYSTYLHTRLYVVRSGMWYFTAVMGILCFVSMVFTLLSSLYFPGEHSLQ